MGRPILPVFVPIVRWALAESPRCFVRGWGGQKNKVKEPEDNKGSDNDWNCDVNVVRMFKQEDSQMAEVNAPLPPLPAPPQLPQLHLKVGLCVDSGAVHCRAELCVPHVLMTLI